MFAPLAFAALATERVELTPSIAVAFPRSPTVLASQAWDLQANSRGRFVLGLGSQVKGHNERRFGIPWSPPAPRLRDYVQALRAIWRCWETRGKLDFQGEHYKLTLMTPDFSPEPTGLPMVPVTIAAVGEAMLRVAGQVCDGVRLHPLCSRRYLEEVCLPRIKDGMRRSGRSRANFDVHRRRLCRRPDPMRRRLRRRWMACARGSASTDRRAPICRSSRCTGCEELGLKLHACRCRAAGARWRRRCPDDVVRIFAACGTYEEIAARSSGGSAASADSIDVNFPAGAPAGLRRELVTDIRRIPHSFAGFDTNW